MKFLCSAELDNTAHIKHSLAMELLLFVKEMCPFCIKVEYFLDQHGLKVPTVNVSEDPEKMDDLIRIGGKSQYPCLVIDGRALYESDDIIAWFEANKQAVQELKHG